MRQKDEEITKFQRYILFQIIHNLDKDGACRLTNRELAHICSDVKPKRISKEVANLVHGHYLVRELNFNANPTKRTLYLTDKAYEVGKEVSYV